MQIGANNTIHDTAIIELGAVIGNNNTIKAGAIIKAGAVIGNDNYIGEYCIIAANAEKVGYLDKQGKASIGHNNHLTKFVTIDAGTEHVTYIGDNNLFLRGSHIGHDVSMLNNCTIACNVAVGGFAIINSWVNIGLNASIHPRSILALGTMLGAGSFYKAKSIDEFKIWAGQPAKIKKDNKIGKDRYLLNLKNSLYE